MELGPPVPSPPARTRSWAGGEGYAVRVGSPATARDTPWYHGTLTGSSDWGGDDGSASQWRGRSPELLRRRGRVGSPTTARRGPRTSPGRQRHEDEAAEGWTPSRGSPAPPYRLSGRGSPKREVRYSPTSSLRRGPSPHRYHGGLEQPSQNDQHLSPLPPDAAAAARSDAIMQLRHDFSQRTGRHCDRKWAKSALVEVNYSSMEDYSAAYAWLVDNVNELEMQEPLSQPSGLAKWVRSIGDWLEVSPPEDVQAFQEWKHERTTRPAWASFQCETEDLHKFWGGRWETPYYLGLETGDCIEARGEYLQFSLWTMDGSAVRLAAEGADLRLHKGTPLSRKLQWAYDNNLLCIVKVVQTDQGLERIRDAEILSWGEPAVVSESGSLPSDESNDHDDDDDYDNDDSERRNKSAIFRSWKQISRKRARRRQQQLSPVLHMELYTMSRVLGRWADLVRTNQMRRRGRKLLQERNLDLLNRLWIGWCRYIRKVRRQKQEIRTSSPGSAREHHGVQSLPRTRSSSRGRKTTSENGRSPGRTASGRSPTRTISGRSSNRVAASMLTSKSKHRQSVPPPASSESGSSSDDYSQTKPARRNAVSPSHTRTRSSTRSPGRSPTRHRSPQHRVRATSRTKTRSPSRSRTRSSARSSDRGPSHYRPSSPQYHVGGTGRSRDEPRRTKSGPSTFRQRHTRSRGIDPAGGQVSDRRRMLRVPDTDDAAWEFKRREAKREAQKAAQAKKQKEKQRKRDVAERLARIEREEMEHREQRKRNRPLTEHERIRRASDAAARRVFEAEGSPNALNFKAFIRFRTRNSSSNFVADEEYQACCEIWERFDKDRGAVTRTDLADILAEMVHRGHIDISDDGVISTTDDSSKQQRSTPKDGRSSINKKSGQQKQASQDETDPRLRKRLDSGGVKDLNHAADLAQKTGRATRQKDGVLKLEFIDDAKTGLQFSRRRFGERGESSGEAFFIVAGTQKDSEAARIEGSEGIEMKNLLLDTVNGTAVEVDDTYAARVEDVFIKQARPVTVTLVPKEIYRRRAAPAADKTPSRPSPTTPRATPRAAPSEQYDSGSASRTPAVDNPDGGFQRDSLNKWASHPELQEILDKWSPAEMKHGEKVLEAMEETIVSIECVTGHRTETLPITWWPKKSESDPLVVRDIDTSAQSDFARVFQDSVDRGMILAKIGAQDCSQVGYGNSMKALQSALMPRKRTKLQFLSLQVREEADDEPIDDGIDAIGYARVIRDYTGTQDGDLTIKRDELIVVLDKTDENWWRGYIEGHPETEGAFPCVNFVEEVSEDEWRQHSASPSLQLEQYCKICRVVFQSSQCPRKHRDSQYLPKQMAIHEGLYSEPDTAEAAVNNSRTPRSQHQAMRQTGRTPASDKRPAVQQQNTKQTASNPAPRKPHALDARQTAVVSKLKSKLSAQAYGGKQGQDPYKLFKSYDRNNDGVLDFHEFKDAVRKGGQITSAMLSDAEVRQVFQHIDVNNNHTLDVDELTKFIWGDEGSNADESIALFNEMWVHAQKAVVQRTGFIVPDDGGTSLWRKISNGRNTISLATFDAGIRRNEPKLHSQECLKIAFKAADANGSMSIQRSEFRMLLEYLVLYCGLQEIFNKMATSTGSGRLTRLQFSQGIRKLIGEAMTDDDIERAFVAIDLDAGGSIRFSELCTWAGSMFKHAYASAAASDEPEPDHTGANGSPTPKSQDVGTPGYKWASHPQLKRLLQDKTLDDMYERTVSVKLNMGARISPLPITWWPMRSETDSLVVKTVNQVNSPISKELEQVTDCMILSKINGQDCRSGYTQSLQLLQSALKPRRQISLEFLSLESKVDDENASPEVLSYVHAVADFQADTEGDLSFVAGDIIAVTGKDEDEWWYGFLEGNPQVEGMFPWRDYVEEIDGPHQTLQPEPEPVPEPNREVMYCKACRCAFDTELCPKNHAALDSRGGQNYITQSVARSERWPSWQDVVSQGTGTSSPKGSSSRQSTSTLHRTATKMGAASAPSAVAQAKNGRYCKACQGSFTSAKCPNNHATFNYLPVAEATAWPGWNSTATKF